MMCAVRFGMRMSRWMGAVRLDEHELKDGMRFG